MDPAASIVDAAFSAVGPAALSYTHSSLCWLIRDHLLSLVADFPALSSSVDAFTDDDGTTATLLNAHGTLPSSPPLLLTIWLPQRYPFYPPLVYVFPTSPAAVIDDHPFIDHSGAASHPYLHTWKYPKSNLSDLARHLVDAFTICPPYIYSDPNLQQKQEALEELVVRLNRDATRFRANVEEDIEHLGCLQAELMKRGSIIAAMEAKLEGELVAGLQRAVGEMVSGTDDLSIWLQRAHKYNSTIYEPKDGYFEGFEARDERSRSLLENEAAELGIEDAIDAMGVALAEGVVGVKEYLKHVRALAREQFFHRALVLKTKASLLRKGRA